MPRACEAKVRLVGAATGSGLPSPSRTETVLESRVGHGQVGLVVAVEVGCGHRVGGRAGGEVGLRAEAAGAVSEQDRDGVGAELATARSGLLSPLKSAVVTE